MTDRNLSQMIASSKSAHRFRLRRLSGFVLLVFAAVLMLSISVPASVSDNYEEMLKENTIDLQELIDKLKIYDRYVDEEETFADPEEEYQTEEATEEIMEEAAAASGEHFQINDQTGYGAIILDQAMLLDDEAEERVMAWLSDITAYCNAVFLSNTDSYSGSEVNYGDRRMTQICMEHGLNGRKAVLLMIDMYKRKLVVYAGEEIHRVITNGISISITDNIYTYATDGNYEKAAREGLWQIYQVLDGQKIAQPMRYITAALLAVFAGLGISFILVRSKTRRKVAEYQEITDALTVSECEPAVSVELRSTKRVKHVESSGGGGGFSGGGGGGGGGGFSSGGGGGSHSF